MSRFWMVCYDISDDRTRRDVETRLLGLGERVQESVFECRLGIDVLRAHFRQLAARLDPATDSLRAYPLCAWCEDRTEWRGEGRRTDDPDLYLV
jgi:CRISPR-associated protein Cas2